MTTIHTKEANEVLVGGVNSPVRAYHAVGGDPVFLKSGKGAKVTDQDNQQYIDYVLSYGPLLAGHAPDSVVADLHNAIIKGTTFGAPTVKETELAKKLRSFYPSMQKIRFVNSGTEATMSAIRLARGFTKKNQIIKFDGCYHGHVDSLLVRTGSGGLTLGKPSSAGVPDALASFTHSLPYNDVDALTTCFNNHSNQIAAIILEPVCGNMGVVLPNHEFLEACQALAKTHGTIIIFDEVMTGFRAGKNGAQGVFNIQPDMTCLGKVIGGGLPMAAYGGREDIMNHLAPLGDVYQAGTLSGNPLAVTAGLSMIELIETYGVYDTAKAQCDRLVSGFKTAINTAGVPMSVQSIGTMFTVFFSAKIPQSLTDVSACNMDQFKQYFHFMKDHGILIPPSQYEANFVSSEHNNDVVDHTIKVFEKWVSHTAN